MAFDVTPDVRRAIDDMLDDRPDIRDAVADLFIMALQVYTDALTRGTPADRLKAAQMFVRPVISTMAHEGVDDETRALHESMREMLREMGAAITSTTGSQIPGARAIGATIIDLPATRDAQ